MQKRGAILLIIYFRFYFWLNRAKRKRRKRIKKVSDSSDEDGDRNKKKQGRKNIRKMIRVADLEEETKEAAKREAERKKRIQERQKLVKFNPFNENEQNYLIIAQNKRKMIFFFKFRIYSTMKCMIINWKRLLSLKNWC